MFKCPGPELISLCHAIDRMPALGQCRRASGRVGQSLLCSHATARRRSHMGQPRLQQPSPGTCRSHYRHAIFFFIIPPHMDINCFGPGGVTCHLLSEPRCCRMTLGWHGLFWGLTSEPMLELPPTRLGTADEKCPLSKVKIKRKQCCYCRLHFSLLLAM